MATASTTTVFNATSSRESRGTKASARVASNEPVSPSSKASTSVILNGSRPGGRKSLREKKEEREKKLRKKNKTPKYILFCRYVVNHKACVTLTTVLTVYALLGDDLRLLTTERPADNTFNFLTIFCIFVFGTEIFLSCWGKEDYFGGFFFILDLVSTGSMVMDLTWVNDALQSDEENLDNLAGSRTAKIGARTARIVRVLRLVRIIKLYKAVYEANQARKKKLERLAMMREGKKPGFADDDDDYMDGDPDMKVETLSRRESRVGKRLSDLTTRRVIILVLSMMFVLPWLQVGSSKLGAAPQYAADEVFSSFEKYKNEGLPVRRAHLRKIYEQSMLHLIFYHNWYTGQQDAECPVSDLLCPNMYYNHLFWVGIVSPNNDEQFLIDRARDMKLSMTTVQQFQQQAATSVNNLFNYGTYPPDVLTVIGSNWTQKCSHKKIHRLGFSLIGKESPSNHYAVPCPEDLRPREKAKFQAFIRTKADAEAWHVGFYFDVRPFLWWDSVMNLIVTGFVCVVLCGSALMFANDADILVLNPLEIMISKVEKIRDNPLLAMKLSDEEFRQEENAKQKEKSIRRSTLSIVKDTLMCASMNESNAEPMETVILEKTIIKIGSLLALGFGEAGANIIEHNMSGVESAMVTAMVEGTRVECVIGCTRIRDFSTATEVLRGNCIKFVNEIAEIVHGIVDELHGAANKNNGEYFLVIWRTSDLDDGYSSKLADMSMFAFTKILGAVHRSPVLATYRIHPGMQRRLRGNSRVNLSFSLHFGWAIEGAVGSEFKIDASYLSPNVSIAESLEAATMLYGVNILVSESVLNICTPQMAAKCRLIDRICLTGQTMELYCIDLDYMSLSIEPALNPLPPWNPRQRFRCRQYLEQEKALKWCDDVTIVSFFNLSPDIATMRFRYTLEFTHVFNMGFQNYSEGEWTVAKRFLSLTKVMLGTEDGPSAALVRYMESFQFETPSGWRGVRDLNADNLGV